MISAGLEGRLPYMTYPEPWRGPPKQPPEFLRPAPKPVPPTSRYNGVSTSPNGMRLAPSQRSVNKYSSPPSISTPVNLTQHKDEIVEELPYYRLYTTPPHLSHFSPFTTMYQSHYTPHMIRSTFPSTPLPSLGESYSPTTPTTLTSSTFLSPPSTFSPPSPVKPGQSVLRDKRITVTQQQQLAQIQQQQQQQQQSNHHHQSASVAAAVAAFKVPSGKEGSLKHRILTRPEDVSRNVVVAVPLDLQQKSTMAESPRKRLNAATMSPPRSPKKSVNNNNSIPGNFTKGSLIQLANGELRRIEDMRTEDFVSSAEHSPELRLADSTVVRIEENPVNGTATITLSYNQRRAQVEVESALEHPFFVFGQGWASCNPERTLQCYRLKVHRLQVGDILISLTPREHNSGAGGGLSTISNSRNSTTILTTATNTAMTVRQLPVDSVPQHMHHHHHHHHHHQDIIEHSINNNNNNNNSNNQVQPINLHTSHEAIMSSPSENSLLVVRKRSAPEQICDEEEQQQQQQQQHQHSATRRHRVE